jgi:hypothetical protein
MRDPCDMPPTLLESQSITELTDLLYEFLPASGNNSYSFPLAAQQAGVTQYWQLEGRSKRPAVLALLEGTLTHRKDRFCDLILAVVKLAIGWRNGKGKPITRNEIANLNKLLLKFQFKIPELNHTEFLNSLAAPVEEVQASLKDCSQEDKLLLKDELFKLTKLEPQVRGFAFEKFSPGCLLPMDLPLVALLGI